MDIVERAKAITLNPAATWPVIDAEKHDAKSLFVPYMLILAAIPAICSFIGLSVIGMSGFGFSYRIPIANGLGMMLTTYVLSLVMTFVLGWIISALAPTFGGKSDQIQGLKLAVFASTPMMLAGVLNILPALSIIGLLAAIYGLYVMYLGLPVLMKNPPDKTIPYMVVLVLASIVSAVVLYSLSNAFAPSMGGMGVGGLGGGNTTISTPAGNATITTTPGAGGAADSASISIKTPEGEVKIDAQKIEAFTKQMEAMAKEMEKNKK
jgi:Yip1 domain